MILRDNTEIQGLIEPASNSYLYGTNDRTVIGLAFEQAYRNSVSGWAIDKANEKLDAVMGYQQELVSIEDGKNKWGLDLKEPESLSKVRHKARLNSFNKYSDLSQQLAQESNGRAYNWTSTIGGVLAGSFFDPLLLVSSLGVGNGIKAIGTAIKPIAKALYSSNPFIKHASRIGLFGGSDVGFNIVTGKIIAKNRGQENYTATDYAFDIALGSIIGTFVGSRMLKAPKVKVGKKLISPDDVVESPFFSKEAVEDASPNPERFRGINLQEPDSVFFKDIDKTKVKLDTDIVPDVKGLSSSDLNTAKAIDFYDKMSHSIDHNMLSEAEKNIMTFVKSNHINSAVNSEYMGSFLGMQESFNNLIKKAYTFVPDNPQSSKAFSVSVEKDIANIINAMSKNSGVPKSLKAMNIKIAPFYQSLTDNGNLFSGKGMADGVKEISYESAKKLSPEGIVSSVDSGLDTIDKLRPFKKSSDVAKPPAKKGVSSPTQQPEQDLSPVVDALKTDKTISSPYKMSIKSLEERVKTLTDESVDAFSADMIADIESIPIGANQDIAVADTLAAMFSSPTISSKKKIKLAAKYYNNFPNSVSMSEVYDKYVAAIKKIQEGKDI